MKARIAEAVAKWTAYEQEYILPCFDIAKEHEIDLPELVRESPGTNCVMLLIEALRRRIPR